MSLIPPRISSLSYFTLLRFHIPQPVSHVMHLFLSIDKFIKTSEVTALLFSFIAISIKAIPSFLPFNL